MTINYYLTKSCEKVTIKVFTKAYRKVVEHTVLGGRRVGVNSDVIPGALLGRLSAGVYYVVIRAESGVEKHERAEPVVILR